MGKRITEINRNKNLHERAITVLAAFGAVIFMAMAGTAAAEDKVRWKMYSPFPPKIPLMGNGAVRLTNSVSQLSGGAFELELFESGTLASGTHYFDHVSAGLIDAAWGFSDFHEDKAKALTIFTGLPFGPRVGPYLAWMAYGGGDDLRNEIYREYGVMGLTCGLLPPEATGWFREKITTPDQYRGLKMRAFGFGAKVMEKLGAETQQLAGGDIIPAFELGTIDAAEFSAPAIDEGFKFYESVSQYTFPGWQLQWVLVELLVNREEYDKLSERNKAALGNACGNNIYRMLAEGEALQFAAVERMKAAGASIHRLPDQVMEALRASWSEVAKEEATKDALFKKVYDSFTAFLQSHKSWDDLAYAD